MPTSIAALPPPSHRIQHKPDYDGAPDVPEISFNELWQDSEKGFSFGDFLDIINPLQHIPIVSSIYRMVTEDEISPGARVAGGALFGGPLGVVGAGITAVFEEASGASVEKHIATLWNNVTGDQAANDQIAAKTSAAPDHTAEDNDILAYADDKANIPVPAVSVPGTGNAAIMASAVANPLSVAAPASPQPVARPPVGVAPLAAVHRTQAAATEPARPDPSAERQRVEQAIERARQAQAGLLLANISADNPAGQQAAEPAGALAETAKVDQRQPFRSHPYMLPRGAPPELVNRAMEQALAKYQATLQQQSPPPAVATPVIRPTDSR
jgi:hypothetical protein